jgi:hypothetical protein
MVRRFRRLRSLTALLAMAISAMVAVGTLDWWHANDEDGAPTAFHDHSAHNPVFGGARSSSRSAEHCYLCHWLRTLGNGFGTVAKYRVAPAKGLRVPHVVDCRTTQLVAAILPARAPPA